MPKAVDLASAAPHLEHGRKGPLVLLFYDGFERQARAGLIGGIKSDLRGRARAMYRRMRGKQVNTGFYVAFLSLWNSLRQIGCDVRVNDFEAAARRPGYPIGIAGYPSVFDHVRLPNPTIFGPGDPGYPDAAARVAQRDELRLIIQPSQWFVDYYRPFCGDKMIRWPVGIDTDNIADASAAEKTIDVVVYDKIRWNYDTVRSHVLDPLLRVLDHRKLSYMVLRYGSHTQADFFSKLRSSRSFAFICEHETQGLACEEAMAMNLPVFAWEEGVLVDPLQRRFAADDLVVSAVPYFDERCGVRFKADNLEASFDDFWQRLATFNPRRYIVDTLGMDRSARDYLTYYDSLASASGYPKFPATGIRDTAQ